MRPEFKVDGAERRNGVETERCRKDKYIEDNPVKAKQKGHRIYGEATEETQRRGSVETKDIQRRRSERGTG